MSLRLRCHWPFEDKTWRASEEEEGRISPEEGTDGSRDRAQNDSKILPLLLLNKSAWETKENS